MIGSIKTDFIGASASLLCLIHCVATPFLFLAKSCSDICCAETPIWWKTIDYLILLISFIAIYRSTKTSNSTPIKWLLWISWISLALIVLNESVNLVDINKNIILIPALALVILHLYNLKYCQCQTDYCCINH